MQEVSGFRDMIYQFLNGNSMYIFSCIGLFLFIRDFKGKKNRKTAVCAVIILIIGLFNPISYKILAEKMGFFSTYYRFLWICPHTVLLAYTIYKLVSYVKNMKYQFLLVIVICAAVLGLHVGRDNLKIPENAYQIPTQTIEVADQIENIMHESGQEKAIVLADTDISNAIRQYDAKICFPFYGYGIAGLDPNLNSEDAYGLMSMLMYNRNDIPQETVNQIVESTGIEYLVINMANTISLSYMEQMGWRIIASTSAYHILAQKGEFTTAPLAEQGIHLEEVNITIPGLTKEYHFLCLADLHIVLDSDEVLEEEKQTIQRRIAGFSAAEKTSAEYWGGYFGNSG